MYKIKKISGQLLHIEKKTSSIFFWNFFVQSSTYDVDFF